MSIFVVSGVVVFVVIVVDLHIINAVKYAIVVSSVVIVSNFSVIIGEESLSMSTWGLLSESEICFIMNKVFVNISGVAASVILLQGTLSSS